MTWIPDMHKSARLSESILCTETLAGCAGREERSPPDSMILQAENSLIKLFNTQQSLSVNEKKEWLQRPR